MSNTLHIAVRVNNSPYSEVADEINNCCPGVFIVADTSGDGIKEWVRQHLKGSPGERWLILSGTVIGEVASAPARFRAV